MTLQKSWDSQRIRELAESFRANESLFGNQTPAIEKRDLRFARVGIFLTIMLLSLGGLAIVGFYGVLIWEIFK